MRRRGGNRNEDDQVHDGPPVLGGRTHLRRARGEWDEEQGPSEAGSARRGRGTSLAVPIAGQGQRAIFVVGGSGRPDGDPDDVRRKRRAISRLYRRARGIPVGQDDRLCEPERGSVPNVRPGHPVAGPLTWAISPGTDQPGTSDGIGRACPSRLHHVREALTGPNNHQ